MANQSNLVNNPFQTVQENVAEKPTTAPQQAQQQAQIIQQEPLTIDQIMHFEPTSTPTQIADSEASKANFIKQFGFDPNVSIAQEQELKHIQEAARIRQQAEQNANVKSFVQNQTNARMTIDDLDHINGIASTIENFSGLKNVSMNDIQMRTLKMNAEKYGGIYKQRYDELTTNPSAGRNIINLVNRNPIDQIQPTSNPQDNSTITNVNNQGNRYVNAVKNGAASLLQTGALSYDLLERGVWKGLDKLTGNDVTGQTPYEPNKVYQALQSLKESKYGESDQLTTLLVGADQASKTAETNNQSPLLASLSYLAKNGSFGDAGELIAQSLPSLGLGFGAGGIAERFAAAGLERYAATTVAQRVAVGRLGAAQANALGFIPKAVQGAAIGGVSDFAGSLAPEYDAQIKSGQDSSQALNRALTKSFAQASVSALGGSLLPFRFGGDIGTYAGQTALQGLTGYASGYAGAKAIGEEYSATDGALNLLLGAVTAIPEAIAVGGGQLRRSQLQDRIDDVASDMAFAEIESRNNEARAKASFFGAGIKELFDRVRASKTNTRNPETIANLARHIQENDIDGQTDVFIDADRFNQLADDHELDLQSLFQSSPELQKEYQRASDINGTMRIPMDELLTTMGSISNEDYLKAFADSIKSDPEAITAGEARQQLARSETEIAQEAQNIKQSFEAERKEQNDEQYVSDQIGTGLKDTQAYSSNFNSQAKTLATSFYKTLSERLNVPIRELFDQVPLRFARDEQQAAQALNDLPSRADSNGNLIDTFDQTDPTGIRGQAVFRQDKNGAVIILGKNADFSTFAHEMGHNFLEMTARFALRPDAPEQLRQDIETVMKWSGSGNNLDDWQKMTPEQRNEMHEKFAESFEQYMFTGQAPSNALRKVFASFRNFMTAVYSNIEKFLGLRTRADLNPEIRDVMDRMLASQEAIDQVQKQRNLEFSITREQATRLGISPKDYLILEDEHNEATAQAVSELERKTLRDLARYRTLRNKSIKAFSEQQKKIRQQVRERVAKEVANEPVYQAIAYLRQPTEPEPRLKRDPTKVDPQFDTLLDAIAKMGGIDADEISSTWGTDQPESYKVSVGKVKKVARKKGLSIETVAERLADDGYLSTDENGKFDTRELEDKFTDSLGGAQFYSNQVDYAKVQYFDSMGMAIKDIDTEQMPDAGKLDLDWLRNNYENNPDVLEQIATTGKYGLAQKNGLDPDMIAEFMGYESGKQMIADIVQSPSAKDEIERRSSELINAQHADLFDENSVQQAIDEAVHNDYRAMILAKELAAVQQLQGRQSDINNITKSVAQQLINESQVKDIRPNLFSAGELKNGKEYDRALKDGRTLDAVRAKRQQLINFHATKEAYKAKEFISKLGDLKDRINGDDKRMAKNRDMNLVAIARYVLDLYSIGGRPSNYEEHIRNMQKYDPLAATQVADLIYQTVDGVISFKVPVREMGDLTFDELKQLDTVVRQIWHLSKANNKIMVEGKAIEFDEVKTNLIGQMANKKTRSRQESILGYKPRNDKSFNPQRAFQSLTRAEQLFTLLDNGKSNGFFHKYIFNPMQDALSFYKIEQRKVMNTMLDIYQQFTPHSGKIDAAELGGTKAVFETKQELLHAILHTGNESNKRRLVLGYGWGERLNDGAVDYTNWNNFFNRMIDEGIITKQDMDSIQKIWDMFDGYKAQAQAVHKRLNGVYFNELPKSPLSTQFGEYDGGYIPADYSKILSVEAEQRGKVSASTQADNLYRAGASTGANFTKSRADNFDGTQLVLDMTSLPGHIDKELRYIFLEEQLKQSSKIFRNREIRDRIEEVAPYSIDNVFSDWLTAASNQSATRQGDYPQFDKIVNRLKQNSGIVLMAGNIKNAVEVYTSIPQLVLAVPPKELISASSKFFTDMASRQSMIQEIKDLSPFMNTRFDEGTNQIRNEIESIVVNKNKFLKGSDFIKQHAYIFQSIFEKPLTAVAWMGAYNDQMGKGMSQQDAIYHADGVVRQYMNDMSPEGVSKIERGTPLMRAMLMFYGWFNMVHNTWAMRNKLVAQDPTLSTASKLGKYGYIYFMMIAAPSMLSKALTLSFQGKLGNDDDENPDDSDITNIVVKSQAEMLMGMLPFARDVLNPIYRTSTETTAFSDRYQVSPIISMGENLVKSGEKTVKLMKDEEVNESTYVKSLLQSATFATGIPFTLVSKPAAYGTAVATGEAQPTGPVDVARGAVNGK